MEFQYNNIFLKMANKLNRKKYRLIGIKNPEKINRLLELDSEYFTFLFLHRNNFDKELDRFFEQIPYKEEDKSD